MKKIKFLQIDFALNFAAKFSLWGILLSSVLIDGTLSKLLTKPYICLFLSGFTYLLFTHKNEESLHHIAMCNGTIDNFSKSALHYLHF